MSVFQLKILTPEKKIFDGTVASITVHGENGQLTVLAGHAPMAGVIAKGPIIIRTKNETLTGVSGKGVLQVSRNEAAVLVHFFKWDGDESEDENIPEKGRGDDLML